MSQQRYQKTKMKETDKQEFAKNPQHSELSNKSF
jgi:hypothetical protein